MKGLFEMQTEGVASKFLDSLLNSIEYSTKPYRPSPTYKPSCMKCLREMFFIMKQVQPDESPADASLIGISESGTDRHSRLQAAMKKMKDFKYINIRSYILEHNLHHLQIKGDFGNEVLVYNKDYNMNFMVDGIIKYQDKYYLLEIKTEAGRKFYDREGVDTVHYNQAACYALSFGINEVIFVYENRDVLDKKVYLFKVTPEMINNVVTMINDCNTYLEANHIPPKPDTAGGKLCQYCNYRRSCRGVKNDNNRN